MINDSYLIGELAEKAGVSVRTIRYYISEGLLPSPDVRGRYSIYDEGYLHRIQLIKRLKDAYLPIKEIRRKLDTETEEQIEQFLALYENDRTLRNDALDYIAALQNEETQPVTKPAAAPSPLDRSFPRQPLEVPMRIKKGEVDESNWRRIVIAPGVELHIIEIEASQLGDHLVDIIEELKRRFQKYV